MKSISSDSVRASVRGSTQSPLGDMRLLLYSTYLAHTWVSQMPLFGQSYHPRLIDLGPAASCPVQLLTADTSRWKYVKYEIHVIYQCSLWLDLPYNRYQKAKLADWNHWRDIWAFTFPGICKWLHLGNLLNNYMCNQSWQLKLCC